MPTYQFPEPLANSHLYHGAVELQVRDGVVKFDTTPDRETLAAITHFGGQPVEEQAAPKAKKSTQKADKASEVTDNDSTDS